MIALRIRSFAKFFICILIGAVFSSAVAFAWTGPTQTAPNGNVSAPLNIGTTDQIKNGPLGVNSLAVFGNAIISTVSGYLNFSTTAGASGYGIRDNAGAMEFKDEGGVWAGIINSITTAIQSYFASGSSNTVSQIKFEDGTVQTSAATSNVPVCTIRSGSGYPSASVSCEAGEVLSGGGCVAGSSGFNPGTLQRSFPSNSTTWSCTSNASVTAYAICCTGIQSATAGGGEGP